MDRLIEIELEKWSKKVEPVPIMLRGARQVGKSYLIKKIAGKFFKNFIEINFELEKIFVERFEQGIIPQELLKFISLTKNEQIEAGSTLLFFDEIQNSHPAILALRYFYEQIPGLHVIAAGSLLDFALNSGEFSFPVGRIQYLYLKPFSFQEYLMAKNLALAKNLRELSLKNTGKDYHDLYLKYIKEYFVLGGMPKVIETYLTQDDYNEALKVQSRIINNYQDDFAKYAKVSEHALLKKTFTRICKTVGQTFKYSRIDPDEKHYGLKKAFELLETANLIYKIKAASGESLPLDYLASDKKFKALYLDIGLMQKVLHSGTKLSQEILLAEDLHQTASGALAEQFTGQELLVNQGFYENAAVYYWENLKKSSDAEVDYLLAYEQQIIPIEVKATINGKLKSLHQFMTKYDSPIGIKISQKALEFSDNILTVPFYLVGELERLVEEVI